MFFSLNINTNKIAILDSYDTKTVNTHDNGVVKHDVLNKNKGKQVSKNKIKKYSTPKNSNLKLNKQDKQSALGGF